MFVVFVFASCCLCLSSAKLKEFIISRDGTRREETRENDKASNILSKAAQRAWQIFTLRQKVATNLQSTAKIIISTAFHTLLPPPFHTFSAQEDAKKVDNKKAKSNRQRSSKGRLEKGTLSLSHTLSPSTTPLWGQGGLYLSARTVTGASRWQHFTQVLPIPALNSCQA